MRQWPYRGRSSSTLLGGVLAIASIAVLGIGIGTVVRDPAGAVAAVIGVVLLTGLLAPLLGDARRWLGCASLNGVLRKMTQSSDATHEAHDGLVTKALDRLNKLKRRIAG